MTELIPRSLFSRTLSLDTDPVTGEEESVLIVLRSDGKVPVVGPTRGLGVAGVELRPDQLGVGVHDVPRLCRPLVPLVTVYPDLMRGLPLEEHPGNPHVY